jgi:hypothetical protein
MNLSSQTYGKIDEGTHVTLDLKTIGIILFFVATVIGMWFSLNASIDEAKELPLPPDPEVTRMEYDMKDQLIRQTIMTTKEDVDEIKSDIRRIEEKIDQLK